jgi:hypothetical protein
MLMVCFPVLAIYPKCPERLRFVENFTTGKEHMPQRFPTSLVNSTTGKGQRLEIVRDPGKFRYREETTPGRFRDREENLFSAQEKFNH